MQEDSRSVSTSVQQLKRGSVSADERGCLGRKRTGVSRHLTREKLRVNGEVLFNKDAPVDAWANHFISLSKSMLPSEEGLQQLKKKIDDLATGFLSNEEYILDVPFTLEEVACAVNKLKSGKASGPDGISAEHLKLDGKPLHLWLMDIVNSTIDMEEVPSSFKLGSICPVYKGGGKDPLLPTGITITPMFSKVLEN